ncbi:MAG TPA: hypothetical protein VEA37_04115 [Flavobacterium sp.]|nr:hypothetical protein [Flavobacterium sp.]
MNALTTKKERVYTEEQQKFLNSLFLPEVKGDFRKAMRMAGYSENTKPSDIIHSLRDEIIEASKNILALNSPRAAMSLIGLLDDPTAAGAVNTIKVAESILNRTGVKEKEESNVTIKAGTGGIFIMPAKETVRPETITITDYEVIENDATPE